MSIYEGNDETISTDNEACYEAVASQEETFLEEEEEEDLRAILVFDESTCIVTGKYEASEMLRLEAARFLQAYSVSTST